MPKTTKTPTIEAPLQDVEVVEEGVFQASQVNHGLPNSIKIADLTDGRLIEAIRQAYDLTTQHQQAAVAWAIYTGALLHQAKQTLPIPNWKEWLQNNFSSQSYVTLNKYRKLFEALSDSGSIASEDLLNLPAAPAAERDATLRKVEKATGGQSLRQLYFDFDIVKKPDPKGGKREGAGRPKYDEAEYAAARRAWWHEKILKPLQVESRKPTWPYCTQADREALYDLFTELANQLKSTLS